MTADSSARTAVFTIVAKNYLHFARTLVDSLARVAAGWEPFVVLADRVDGYFDPARERFRLVTMAELEIPAAQKLAFRYSVVELSTAVKPWSFRWLFAQGYERVVYLDPDIFVYEPLREVEEAWNEGALAVLTPHLTGRLRDNCRPSERDVLLSGAYNLGFIALRYHGYLQGLLEYWCEKSHREFLSDVDHGLFTDQRWMDLVPGMFPDVHILRHEGYDVAYWNLPHRDVRREGHRFIVNGVPLVFFHFSGLDPIHPALFSRHQDRYRLADLGPAAELVRGYCAVLVANGLDQCREWPYAFGSFRDGLPIADALRRLYQTSAELERFAGDDPFALDLRAVAGPSDGRQPPVSWIMRALHHVRPDLQTAFPEPLGGSRQAFACWFVESAEREHGLSPDYVEPMRRALREQAGPASSDPSVADAMPEPIGSHAEGPGIWDGEMLIGAVRKALVALREGRLPLWPGRWVGLFRLHRAELAEYRRRIATAPPPLPWDSGPESGARRSWADMAGFHERGEAEREAGVVWMGPVASIVLRGARPGARLVVRGEHDADVFRRAHATRRIVLRLDVEGALVGERALDRSGPFAIDATLPEHVADDAVLVLRSSHAFVPALVGAGEDGRELSVRIRGIDLDGHALLDAGRRGHPYRARSADAPPGLNLVGYLEDATGVGQSVSACAAACDANGIAVELFDARAVVPCRGRHAVNLLHVNADQVPSVCAALGSAFFRGRLTAAVWHWELEEFPEDYLSSFSWVDEIWASSRFIQHAIADCSPVPVVYVPNCVQVQPSANPSRAAFGLPEDVFLFLVMYDMRSIQERKNPRGALAAFRRAFPDPARVGLVVKVNHADEFPDELAEVRGVVEETPGALLILGTLGRQAVYDLEAVCDAYVSLHRSEGFGYNIAECMLLGKPVVATNWSGNADFMDHRNSCPVDYQLSTLARSYGPYRQGCRWADPDLDQAAEYLQRLVDDAAYRCRIAERGQATIAEGYSAAAVGRRYRRRLELLGRLG